MGMKFAKSLLIELCKSMKGIGVYLVLDDGGLSRGLDWSKAKTDNRELVRRIQDLVYLVDELEVFLAALPDGRYSPQRIWNELEGQGMFSEVEGE